MSPRRVCSRHRGEVDRLVVPWGFLSVLFKGGCNVSLFPVTVTSPDCQDFSNIMENALATPSTNSLRTLRCISWGPMSLGHQVPLCLDSSSGHMIFSYTGWNFVPPATFCHPSIHPLKRCGKRGCQWRLRQGKFLSPSVFTLSIVSSILVLLTRGRKTSFDLPVVALVVVIFTPGQVQLDLHLGLPPYITRQRSSNPVFLQ